MKCCCQTISGEAEGLPFWFLLRSVCRSEFCYGNLRPTEPLETLHGFRSTPKDFGRKWKAEWGRTWAWWPFFFDQHLICWWSKVAGHFFKWFDLNVGFLIPELAVCGLQLTSEKTKMLTTSPLDTSNVVDLCGELVRVILADLLHKYSGRNFSSNSLGKNNLDVAHPFQVACNKFQNIYLWNKHIFAVLRLKSFEAVVFPAMFFGLATLPWTKVCWQKLGAVRFVL